MFQNWDKFEFYGKGDLRLKVQAWGTRASDDLKEGEPLQVVKRDWILLGISIIDILSMNEETNEYFFQD